MHRGGPAGAAEPCTLWRLLPRPMRARTAPLSVASPFFPLQPSRPMLRPDCARTPACACTPVCGVLSRRSPPPYGALWRRACSGGCPEWPSWYSVAAPWQTRTNSSYPPPCSPPQATCSGSGTLPGISPRHPKAAQGFVRSGQEWLLCCVPPPPSCVFILSPHCPDCGLPERPAAVVHGDPKPLLFPGLFCTAPRPTSSYCRAEVAARAACGIFGVLVPHAIPVTSVTGPESCFSSAVRPVQPPPSNGCSSLAH